ncbi:beta-galactosidase [Granulicella sp. 5B5]|nr:beta-galactosidase [Granulicella sp. 5B5]
MLLQGVWRLTVAALAGVLALGVVAQTPLQVKGDRFELRGKPFQILSGEVEYARIPRADWADRLRKVHAMGLNTITVYVFWNLHEPKPGVFDFSGQNDVAAFLRAAQAEGLYVVLRPGPYVCAEWDLGGYPAWLLKDHTMVLRSMQPQYLAAVRTWMMRLGKELSPLQASRGGPIIAVQVENEYGSFQVPDDGGAYMRTMEQMVRDAGFGESLLYTADGPEELPKGSLPDLPAGIDFGTGDAAQGIAVFKKYRPNAPVYVAEYWDGWFDHWGSKHEVTDAAKQEAELRDVIAKGYSISLYMIHGGTSFGWMNGANWDRNKYEPDVSSYDYDAPIDEAGRLRPKYYAMRKIIAEATHVTPPAVPELVPMMTLPEMRLTETRPLWEKLPKAIEAEAPLAMEDVDQAYGYMLYRTRLKSDVRGAVLHISELHSYARVYLDGELAGVIDRRLGETDLPLTAHAGQRLDLLVENTGRINFSVKLRGERAGILGDVVLGGVTLHGWQMVPLPLEEPPVDGYSAKTCSGPCFYRGTFTVSSPGDTFLNTERLGKGVVWVNGHLLGRFWNVGPMGSLYVPGVWLHAGSNAVTVFDLNGGAAEIRGDDHPTYLQPVAESTAADR